MKKKMTAFALLAAFAILLIIPVTVFSVGFFSPARFEKTYYAELGEMVKKAETAQGKKILILGSSSVPFGVDSALLERSLKESGHDYAVCNFGLYGAMGMKVMLDLSEHTLGADDIVIFAPETYAAVMTLSFPSKEIWRAMDGNFGLLRYLKKEDIPGMVGTFSNFAAEKFSSAKRTGSGIYAKSSFDENCDLKNYPRAGNIMEGGYDGNGVISFIDIAGEGFFDYVNAYAKRIRKRGAEIYFAFCPMNRSALADDSAEGIEKYYDYIADNLDLDILGNPNDAVMDAEWFYDTNFHLNEAGMTVHTVTLLKNIKTQFGDSGVTDIPLPEKPEFIVSDDAGEEDNSDADCFLYRESGDGYEIVGLGESGKGRTFLTVPCRYNGKKVTSFTADTFAGNERIEEIVLQENIRKLSDNCFDGCSSLRKIHLRQTDPVGLSVGFSLLSGAENAFVYVPRVALSVYLDNYFWGYYSDRLRGEEV